MKTPKKMRIVLLATAVLLLPVRAYAGCGSVWSQPSLHDELNDGVNIAAHPSLSSDDLTMYFSRHIPSLGYKCVVEAYRGIPDGPFTSERVLTELYTTGHHVRAPWISNDSLRLYYMDNSIGGIAKIKMASRAEPNSVWTPTTIFDELNEGGYNAAAPTLTSDELVIIFHSDRPGSAGSGYNLWIATRTEPNGIFGNVIPLDEINSSLNEMQPHLQPDGLTLYFDRGYGTPDWDIYKATRPSREDPFSNVEYVEINADTYDESAAHVTSDEKAIYFVSDRGAGGIWFSQLIDVEAFHVDGAGGDDGNDGLTKETAFATIQKGVDTAEDGCEVLVWPGTYDENINFNGKAITVQSAAEAAIISPTTGYAFEFFSAEGPDTVLKNFIIADGQYGIHVDIGCSPTITNLTIANNDFGISAVGNADPNISNCIFYNNTYGDIEGCEAKYSLFSGDLDGGLISYWNLDEGQGDTAYDSVGSNHGTLYGPNWTTGQIGGALNFDGTDDYVEITNSTNLQKPLPITLSAWARISPDGDRDVILSLDNQTNYYCGIEFGISTAMLFYVHAGDALGTGPAHRKNVLGTTVLMTDTWYHLVAVVGSMDDMRLYVNGVLEEPNPASSGTATTMDYCENNALIGCREGSSSSYFFGGVIDEVAVWDRALDSGEIQQIYTDGLAAHMMGADPLFADAGAGDYHLLSERGRYWPDYDVWVLDSQTSPAIDGGNPIQNPGDEPMPNGGRINMGAYGGTAWASMSEWPLEGDINQDGIVNLADVGIVAVEWLSSLLWIE